MHIACTFVLSSILVELFIAKSHDARLVASYVIPVLVVGVVFDLVLQKLVKAAFWVNLIEVVVITFIVIMNSSLVN